MLRRIETIGSTPASGRSAVIVGLCVATIAAIAGCDRPAEARRQPPPLEVVVVEARTMDVPLTAEPNGVTRSLAEVSVRARVRGFLEQVNFVEGENVKKGDVLFEIEKAPYQATLDSALAKLAEAQATLQQAKDSKAREIATAQLGVDQAVLALNRVEESRQRALLARNAASPQDVDRATANRQRSEAQVEADQASLEQARVDYNINILTAQAKVAAAQAEVDRARIDLGYCTMKAEIDGRIGEAKVKAGNLVGPLSNTASVDYTELATIQQLVPMGVDIQCSSRYIDRATRLIRDGLKVVINRPGLRGEADHQHAGTAFFIDNKIDPTTATVLIKAQVSNDDESLLPGEYVKVDIVIGELPGAIVVPERAVSETQAGPSVFVVNDKDIVERVVVSSEFTYEGLRVIEKGVFEGQRVIVDGLQLVRPGQEVRPRPLAPDGSSSATSARDGTHSNPS